MKNKHNFCIREVIEQNSHIGQIEQIKFKEMVHCLWNQNNEIFFGGKVMWLVVLLIFLIMIQFQIEL